MMPQVINRRKRARRSSNAEDIKVAGRDEPGQRPERIRYVLRAMAIKPSMAPRAQSIHPLRAGIADWGSSGTVYVEVLLAGLVSVVVLDTIAVSPKVEGDATLGGLIVSVIGFAGPTFSVGRVQVTVPATLLQVQPVPEALPKVAPAGSTSTTDTLAAGEGPRFVTVMV